MVQNTKIQRRAAAISSPLLCRQSSATNFGSLPNQPVEGKDESVEKVHQSPQPKSRVNQIRGTESSSKPTIPILIRTTSINSLYHSHAAIKDGHPTDVDNGRWSYETSVAAQNVNKHNERNEAAVKGRTLEGATAQKEKQPIPPQEKGSDRVSENPEAAST